MFAVEKEYRNSNVDALFNVNANKFTLQFKALHENIK